MIPKTAKKKLRYVCDFCGKEFHKGDSYYKSSGCNFLAHGKVYTILPRGLYCCPECFTKHSPIDILSGRFRDKCGIQYTDFASGKDLEIFYWARKEE